jgi:hypothetical protein
VFAVPFNSPFLIMNHRTFLAFVFPSCLASLGRSEVPQKRLPPLGNCKECGNHLEWTQGLFVQTDREDAVLGLRVRARGASSVIHTRMNLDFLSWRIQKIC